MKPLSLLFLLLLLPAIAFCQTIVSPAVGSSDDASTKIVKIDVTKNYTAVVFKHVATAKGNWVQLNRSIYLQDADGEDRYNYLRSEGIALRPLKDSATVDNQETNFTVYFEKLKPGTKHINIIERALSMTDRVNGTNFFNYYDVSLDKSDTTVHQWGSRYTTIITGNGTSTADSTVVSPFSNRGAFSMGTMMTSMYNAALEAQLKFYSDKARIDEMAEIDKNYYDALIKAGFNADQALKILTSRSLISSGASGK